MVDEFAWPGWVRPQLRRAVELAHRCTSRSPQVALAPELYRTWFNPIVEAPAELARASAPPVGIYRTAHAGSRLRLVRDGFVTIGRHDAVGRDGWWRTWGPAWRPTVSRRHSVRLVMSPRRQELAVLVDTVTTAMLDEEVPWMLACTTDLRRLRRVGGAVLHVPHGWTPAPRLVADLDRLLRPVTPPLCLEIGSGIGLADDPDNGMSFGEHRCHLIAMALRPSPGRPDARAPMQAIAEVFAAHGVDPAHPYLSRTAAEQASAAS